MITRWVPENTACTSHLQWLCAPSAILIGRHRFRNHLALALLKSKRRLKYNTSLIMQYRVAVGKIHVLLAVTYQFPCLQYNLSGLKYP
ncbi:hypothetical protein D3C73_1490340 [compost metagenome]